MFHKYLSAYAATALLLGQVGFHPFVIALAESPLSPEPTKIEVASVIQESNKVLQSTPADVQEEPQTAPSNPDLFTIGNQNGSTTRIEVKTDNAHHQASIFLNEAEVIRFRSEAGGITPEVRARLVAKHLYEYLNAGQPAAKLQADLDGSQVVIRLDQATLVTVDALNAKAAGSTPEKLAFIWVNRMREALGEKALSWKDCPKLARVEYQKTGRVERGVASWYGGRFVGRRTASGKRFNGIDLTAAHKTLPFGTMVRVVNHRNQKSCVVQITDRGPYAHGRIIDVSKAAAKELGMVGSGVAKVSIEVVTLPKKS